jgi:hypothetical protein
MEKARAVIRSVDVGFALRDVVKLALGHAA